MTQEVAKRKTVVSLTYKPTTKPQTMNTQQNTYKIFFSNGKPSEIYITASNIKEACILAKPLAKEHRLDNYMVKRCYNGGMMGS